MMRTTRTERSRPLRLLSGLALLTLCLPMQSCFTTGLWSSDIDDRSKAGLTPFAVALDVFTFPAQLAIFKGHGHHGHHGHHGRSSCR